MRKTITKIICDNCRDEIEEAYIHFEKGVVVQSNGKTINSPMGSHHTEMEEKTFCCTECMFDYTDKKNGGKRNDLYLPCDQVDIQLKHGTKKILGK